MILRTLIAFQLSCSVALAGQGMGPGPGVKGYAGGGGGTTLAGITNRTLTASQDSGGTQNSVAESFTATSSGLLTKGYASVFDDGGDGGKMCVWNGSTGEVIECSAAVKPLPGSYVSPVEFTFSGTVSITSGTSYLLGVQGEHYVIFRNNGGSWVTQYSTGNYNTPITFSYTGSGGTYGGMNIWITN